MIQQIFVPQDEALQYISNELSADRGELARFLLEQIDFCAGRVFSFLPEDVNPNRIKNFASGGLVFEGGGRDQITRFLLQKLTATDDTVMVFEEELMAQEIWHSIEKEEDYYFYYKERVYYFLPSSIEPDLLQVEHRMRTASFTRYPGFGILTSLPFSLHKAQQLDLDQLEILVRHITHLIIEAYDGEAWIIWSKDKD